MLDLIERIEAATGPDREIDADIALATGWQELPGDNWLGPLGEISVPHYTASLDDAMGLVGDNFWRVEDHPLSGISAIVDDQQGYAATPPLALCAAALRAREAQS